MAVRIAIVEDEKSAARALEQAIQRKPSACVVILRCR